MRALALLTLLLLNGGGGPYPVPPQVTVSNVAPTPYGVPGFMVALHVDFSAADGGIDDVTVLAPGSYPYKIRVFESDLVVFTAKPGSNATVRDTTGGGGNALSGALDTSIAAVSWDTRNFDSRTVDLRVGDAGIYLRRSDSAVAGELFMHVMLMP